MYGMTLRRIADACGGILQIPKGQEHLADTEVTAIVTDSRKAGEGSLFAAIVGERVDGHSFIDQVYAQGALCVISEKDLPDAKGCCIRVQSTLNALKGIAQMYRQMLGIPVVGITGSVGKTSTKEMIASVLSQKFNVHKTKGNFNNELGLPLTIFGLTNEHEMAVLEMGISDFGEMHRLAMIARPDTCVITNIGQCHLEFLGDRDGVLRAKTEIFDFLKEDGYIVLNGNDDRLSEVRHVHGIEPVFYGLPEEAAQEKNSALPGNAGRMNPDDRAAGAEETPAEEEVPAADEAPAAKEAPATEEKMSAEAPLGARPADGKGDGPCLAFYATDITPLGLRGIRCRIHTPEGSFEVSIPIPGRHMVMNALAGAAVGMHYGLTKEQIKAGVESVEHVGGRLNIIETERFTVIDDCYNANPMSMAASLDVLAGARGAEGARKGRLTAILGDMFELGPDELAMHAGVGAHAAGNGIDLLVTIGERSRSMYDAAQEAGMAHVYWFASVDDFLKEAGDLLQDGDTVLVKASHAMKFEKIVEKLTQPTR